MRAGRDQFVGASRTPANCSAAVADAARCAIAVVAGIAGNVRLQRLVLVPVHRDRAVMEHVGQVPRDEILREARRRRRWDRVHQGDRAGRLQQGAWSAAGWRPSGSAGPRSGRIWHEHSLRTPSSHRRGVTSERAGGMSRPGVTGRAARILTGPIAHGPDRPRSARLLTAVLGDFE